MNVHDVEITIDPAGSAAEDVRRCLRVIIGTRAGTLALDRDFGIDWSFLDMPTEAAKAAFTAEIFSKVEKYEPRAHISRVTFASDASGRFIPRIEVDALNV